MNILEAIKSDVEFNQIAKDLPEEKVIGLSEWAKSKFEVIFKIIKDERKVMDLYKEQRDSMIDVLAGILEMTPEEVCTIYFPIKTITPEDVCRLYKKSKKN